MADDPKKIVVLGCTGSIGDTCFKVLENLGNGYEIVGLAGGSKVEKLIARAHCWKPQKICVIDTEARERVQSAVPQVEVVCGAEGLCELATMPEADLVLNGLVGAVGLAPTLAALAQGKTVAMANKEPLVMAGGLILQQAERGGGTVLPLDSEPNAIWQCLKGEDRKSLKRIILTASGGPFWGRNREQMRDITPEQAIEHPTWKMGAKISVDSATLMNKGFEVIEAAWLFGLAVEQVDVVVHRQSVVHALVEFADGSLLAHMGKTDMMLPIQYALTHPERREVPLDNLDLNQVGQLSFAAPDRANFPCLDLCYEAGRSGGTFPAVLNAANEEAVGAFLARKIGFLDIADLNRDVLARCGTQEVVSLESILDEDCCARRLAREWVAGRAG
ncbi:MAG: 1-deoxy-D-xylulose-5-phosphate reductoisomerase [Gemmatimonadetes bacterium]|nr:1-deoxy-D-xylulose-5-phosphate reductoisomerase [Gemmatimonadota bacterium]MYI62745.1 1-deoxy-D-xylulose-5-phosphate reductoisomerase [Gemmatimonadota bacterium]